MTLRRRTSRQAPRGERTPKLGSFVVVGGRRCHVLAKGRGRPIVLLHGNGGLGEEILSAFPRLEGVRWIAPDRPGYGRSDPLPEGYDDPVSQAVWLDGLLARLAPAPVTLVAHSLAAGLALALAAARPDRVSRLVLLAPFCRPTPERWMPALRLASAPLIGGFLRRVVVPPLVRRMRTRLIKRFMAPNRPPPWLRGFPVTQAASPQGIKTMAAELKAFNAAIRHIGRDLQLTRSVTVVHGLSDETADPRWHLPWLRDRTTDLHCLLLRGCGHAVHHAAPNLVLQAILHDRVWFSATFGHQTPTEFSRELARYARQTRDQHSGFALAGGPAGRADAEQRRGERILGA
jgi:pimeloyl-ACP methyl ester carboxylesterase